MANQSASWEVTNQTPTTGQGPDNRYGPGQQVTIRTGNGHLGTFFVPASAYNAENVRKLAAELAARLDAVGSLKG